MAAPSARRRAPRTTTVASCAERGLDLTVVGLCCALVPLALLLPQPFEDRLAVLQQTSGSRAGEHALDRARRVLGSRAATLPSRPFFAASRADEFDRTIRSSIAPPFWVLAAGVGADPLAAALARLPDYSVETLEEPRWSAQDRSESTDEEGAGGGREALNWTLPFEDEMFDAIVLSYVLEHSLDVPGMLAEAARALRPGGLLLCESVDRSLASFLGIRAVASAFGYGSLDWRFFIRPEEMELGVEEAGFRNFSYKAWRPSLRAFLELPPLAAGLLAPADLSGTWAASGSLPVTVLYLAQATKVRQRYPEYKVGEPCLLRSPEPSEEDVFSLCRVVGHGFEPDAYDLECCEGKEERATNVHAEFLYRWPLFGIGTLARVWHAETWLDCRVVSLGSPACTWTVELLGSGQELADAPHDHLQPPAEWQPGDEAELEAKGPNSTNSSNSSTWIPCTVLGAGYWRGTYAVRVETPKGPRPYQDYPRIAPAHLRPRGGARKAPAEVTPQREDG